MCTCSSLNPFICEPATHYSPSILCCPVCWCRHWQRRAAQPVQGGLLDKHTKEETSCVWGNNKTQKAVISDHLLGPTDIQLWEYTTIPSYVKWTTLCVCIIRMFVADLSWELTTAPQLMSNLAVLIWPLDSDFLAHKAINAVYWSTNNKQMCI